MSTRTYPSIEVWLDSASQPGESRWCVSLMTDDGDVERCLESHKRYGDAASRAVELAIRRRMPAWFCNIECLYQPLPDSAMAAVRAIGEHVGRSLAEITLNEGLDREWTGIENEDADYMRANGLKDGTPEWAMAEEIAEETYLAILNNSAC